MNWRKLEVVLTKIVRWGSPIALGAFCIHVFVPEWLPGPMTILFALGGYLVLLSYCARTVVQRIAYGCERPLGE